MSLEKITAKLAEFENVEKAATPGDWYVEGEEVRHQYDEYSFNEGIADHSVQICQVGRISKALDSRHTNREFIAQSRTMVPALIKAVRVLSECVQGTADAYPKSAAFTNNSGDRSREALEQAAKILEET